MKIVSKRKVVRKTMTELKCEACETTGFIVSIEKVWEAYPMSLDTDGCVAYDTPKFIDGSIEVIICQNCDTEYGHDPEAVRRLAV